MIMKLAWKKQVLLSFIILFSVYLMMVILGFVHGLKTSVMYDRLISYNENLHKLGQLSIAIQKYEGIIDQAFTFDPSTVRDQFQALFAEMQENLNFIRETDSEINNERLRQIQGDLMTLNQMMEGLLDMDLDRLQEGRINQIIIEVYAQLEGVREKIEAFNQEYMSSLRWIVSSQHDRSTAVSRFMMWSSVANMILIVIVFFVMYMAMRRRLEIVQHHIHHIRQEMSGMGESLTEVQVAAGTKPLDEMDQVLQTIDQLMGSLRNWHSNQGENANKLEKTKNKEKQQKGDYPLHLVRELPVAIIVYKAVDDGEDFQILELNREVERIEKVYREDLIGKRITLVFPGIRKFGLIDVFKQVWITGNPMHHPMAFYEDERLAGYRDNYVYKLDSGEIVAVYSSDTSAIRFSFDSPKTPSQKSFRKKV